MEKKKSNNTGQVLIGSKQSDLKKNYKLAVCSLLTNCSKEEFDKEFLRFTSAERECLHRIYIKVITSLHENIEDDFESLFLEAQIGTALDTVEQLVEEQSLDPLFSDKTNLMDVVHNLSTVRKNEIQYLMGMLERAEEQNRLIKARVELLKKGRQDVSGTADVVEKFRSAILNYGASNDGL